MASSQISGQCFAPTLFVCGQSIGLNKDDESKEKKELDLKIVAILIAAILWVGKASALDTTLSVPKSKIIDTSIRDTSAQVPLNQVSKDTSTGLPLKGSAPPDKNVNQYGEDDMGIQTRVADATEKSVFWSKWTAIGTIFISSLAFFVSILQWYLSNHQSEIQTRAYLEPEIKNPKLINTNEGFRIPLEMSIRNIGQTPARDIRSSISFYVEDGPTKQKRPISSPIIVTAFTLSAGESEQISHNLDLDASIVANAIKQVPDVQIYLKGYSHYTDIFRKKRTRKWCWNLFEYRPETNEFLPVKEHDQEKET